MSNFKLLCAVYECSEDAKTLNQSAERVWERHYANIYNKHLSLKSINRILNVILTAVNIVDNIDKEVPEIADAIRMYEDSKNFTIFDRIHNLENYDIPFNVIKGADDLHYTVTMDEPSMK